MLFGFMVGFGFTMHIALLNVLRQINSGSQFDFGGSYEFCDNYYYYYPYTYFYYPSYIYNTERYHQCLSKKEDDERIVESFNTPLRSILTMAYAMVGLFDPEVLFKTGNLSNLVITLFVLYLALQTIVMFNMLIAAMGDAFDGVRAAEEESFLMARAEFIDQYEASLSNDSIKAIEEKVGKCLYVLIPKDLQLEKSVPFWKGRMTTIKEDVRKIVVDSHEDITHKMDQQTEEMDRLIQNMDRQNQDIHLLSQNINHLAQNMNEMFTALRNDIQVLKDDLKSNMKTLEQRIQRLEK
eukprot:g3226.t1